MVCVHHGSRLEWYLHNFFSYFCMKTYIVGTYKKCLNEMLLMRAPTTYVFSCRNKKKNLAENTALLGVCFQQKDV